MRAFLRLASLPCYSVLLLWASKHHHHFEPRKREILIAHDQVIVLAGRKGLGMREGAESRLHNKQKITCELRLRSNQQRSTIVPAITLGPLSRAIVGGSGHQSVDRGCARRRELRVACRCRSRRRSRQSNSRRARVGTVL